jgi:hypothetical protein
MLDYTVPLEGYKLAHFQESTSSFGVIGVQVFVKVNPERDLTSDEKSVIRRKCDEIEKVIAKETVSRDPQRAENRKIEKAEIIRLFPQPIYVEEIPNGYCSDWCCQDKPWFKVTTSIGRFIIGWRKNVINIDWSETIVKDKGKDIFPDVKSTVGEKNIHAWSYLDAGKFIATLIAKGEKETNA